MITGLAKVTAIGVVAYCSMHGANNAKDQINQFVGLPKRIMTVYELKQIHRLILYELADGVPHSIELVKFCAEELSASGRDPGKDYWLSPYRLFYRGSLYQENSSVTLGYDDSDHFVVVSAGVDTKFRTKDDLTSKNDSSEEVQDLIKQIESAAEKEKSKSPS